LESSASSEYPPISKNNKDSSSGGQDLGAGAVTVAAVAGEDTEDVAAGAHHSLEGTTVGGAGDLEEIIHISY
jgi:hypothetical protein